MTASRDDAPTLIAGPGEIAAVADALRGAGWFALDLEFVSEGRYIPELCVVQVAWPGPEPGVALIDAIDAPLEPIFEVIASPDIEVVAHAGRQDLALLATRFQVIAANFWDTQLAAAFAGIGEQVGYARLIKDLCDAQIDKGPQFTDWAARPLSERQLRYAADDVLFLRQVWPVLRDRLAARGRLAWVAEESAALVAEVTTRRPPEEMYRNLGGWGQLRGAALGALVELAEWREREALATNKPPSWILGDSAMLELARRRARGEGSMRRIKGVGPGTIKRYGGDIAAAIRRGAEREIDPRRRPQGALSTPRQALAQLICSLIQSRCAHETLPPKLVGGRGDAEALVASHFGEAEGEGAALLRGWRRELVGADALALLRGEVALAVSGEIVETRPSTSPQG